MKLHFFLADTRGTKFWEGTIDCAYIPRVGESILLAPEQHPDGAALPSPGETPGLFKIESVQHWIDNHGNLNIPTIFARERTEV